MGFWFKALDIDFVQVLEVPKEFIQFSLKCDQFVFFQVKPGEVGHMPHFIKRNPHEQDYIHAAYSQAKMQQHRKRQVVPVVCWVTVTLVCFSLFAYRVRRHIPPGDRNALAFDARPFLRAASEQEIDWKPLGEEALSQAAKEDKLIFVAVGSNSTRFARFADRNGFTNQDVEEALSRFVCIRVDGLIRPELVNNTMPITRAIDGRDPGVLYLVFTPDLKLVAERTIQTTDDRLDAKRFLAFLGSAQAATRNPDSQETLQQRQEAQYQELMGDAAHQLPNLEGHAAALRSNFRPESGSWPSPQAEYPYPQSWAYLWTHSNNLAEVEGYALSLAGSPMVDWIDGGFYCKSVAFAWKKPVYDKMSEQNADLMLFYAQLHCATGKTLYRRLALDTFDLLANRLAESGIVRAYIRGDERQMDRSERGSFSPRRMRDLLNPEEREIARKDLVLRVEENPTMVPYLRNPNDPDILHRVDPILAKLRAGVKDAERVVGENKTAQISAVCASRMLLTATLLGDENRLIIAETVYEELERFIEQNGEVVRALDLLEAEEPYLGDYLAMSEARLAYYTITGDELALRDGIRFFESALKRFETEENGVLATTQPGFFSKSFPAWQLPEFYDGYSGSTTASAISLAFKYAAWLRNAKPRDLDWSSKSERFLNFAETSVAHFGALSDRVQRRMSSFFLAASQVLNHRYIVVFDEFPNRRAAEIQRIAPMAWVLPVQISANSPIKPGVYLRLDEHLTGPMQPADVVRAVRL